MMQQCSKSRAYYSYDYNTMAISIQYDLLYVSGV